MDAYLLAMDAGKPGVYNVGTDRFGTLREALDHVALGADDGAQAGEVVADVEQLADEFRSESPRPEPPGQAGRRSSTGT